MGGLTMIGVTGEVYIPSWMEIVISLGVVSAAALAFLFAVEHLHIWESRPAHPEADAFTPPRFAHTSEVWLGSPRVAARTKYSLAFVLSFALAFAFIPESKIESKGVESVTALKARGGDQLFIEGNRDWFGTQFDHAKHVDSLGHKESCVR